MANSDILRLKKVFEDAAFLLPLPGTLVKLIRAIDTDMASAIDLEKIIISDPALAANFLRVSASSDHQAIIGNPSTIRSAIMMMGQRTVRTLAVSMAMKEMILLGERSEYFDPLRFTNHLLASAFFARYLFTRQLRIGSFETVWTQEEVFAVALLHELGFGVLAQGAPDAYGRTYAMAKRSGTSLESTFKKLYSESIYSLGAIAARSWKLPAPFASTLDCLEKPEDCESESIAVVCVAYGNLLAEQAGYRLVAWDTDLPPLTELAQTMLLSEDEIPQIIEMVKSQIESYIVAESDTPVSGVTEKSEL